MILFSDYCTLESNKTCTTVCKNLSQYNTGAMIIAFVADILTFLFEIYLCFSFFFIDELYHFVKISNIINHLNDLTWV